MIDQIINYFATFIGFVEVVFEYFLNFITTLILAVGFVAQAQFSTLAVTPLLPPIIGTMVVISIAVFVIRFLLLK